MRSVIRSLAAGGLLATLLLGSAGTTALAGNGASTFGYQVDDAWCFQDAVYRYCFDTQGHVQFVESANGVEAVMSTLRQTTVVYQGDTVVGESRQTNADLFRYGDDVFVLQSATHVRSEFLDQTCVYTTFLRIDDYEIVVDKWLAPDCH